MVALLELAAVIATGFTAFFDGIVFMPGLRVLWLLDLASTLCLMQPARDADLTPSTGTGR